MEDDVVGMVQAYRLSRLLRQAGLVPLDVWSRYARTGGTVGDREVDAYLHQCLVLPADERDALADAANELTRRQGLVPAPYSDQLCGPAGLTHGHGRRER